MREVTFKDGQSYTDIDMKLSINIWPNYLKSILLPGILLTILLNIHFNGIAQTYPIPDPKFKQFLISTYPAVMDNTTGELIIPFAADSVNGVMDCSNLNIKDLSGIQYFEKINRLLCNKNELSFIPSLANIDTLHGLDCSNNFLTELPAFRNGGAPGLHYLNYSNNLIDSLPNFFTFNSLDTIICHNNHLTFEDFAYVDPISLQVFIYSPQNNVEVLSRIELADNDSITLTFPKDKNVFTNQYKIFKNNVLYQDLSNVNSFNLSQVTKSDAGRYTWQATNNQYPDLILKSNEIDVVVLNNSNAIFTPDGDNINDSYYIPCDGIIRIYNKLGVVVKELSGSEYWDGTDLQGKPVQSGAYILRCGDKIISSITLIR